ncbi:hypothetical protein OGR47_04320 [Methylocystis sp. MJC1]|jgi:hypothetical protein|uniref:DUF2946 family protein n=1 Tax=Methylocystis sp. MJC1 TaxID=2654282 RepID=UPI0013EE0ED6|nr:DUF2946 family protein [Methylocystis sp. MJC1]KAF2991219.1 hypothetical protein MJC1_01568 [Methylocystis sp. MJC1]MBU6526241.1 hypothetical protein [Methylocystis sp. MJC1]UZX12695.1 hypothetical protein OGR47_04320 [Methylocystis sp. MJC1]
MLRCWLTVLLVACSLIFQGAWLNHSHLATTAQGDDTFALTCAKAGGAGDYNAPAHNAPLKDHCSACILCGANFLALTAVVLALVLSGDFPERIVAFVRQDFKPAAFQALRPPTRAPPFFS